MAESSCPHSASSAEQRLIARAVEAYSRADDELGYLRRHWSAQSGMPSFFREKAEEQIKVAEERLRLAAHDLAVARGLSTAPPAPILPLPRRLRPEPEGEGRAV